jgi:hypothetical protein
MNQQTQETQEQINERIRDKIWDEHASGLDGGDDDDEEDE